MSNVLAVITAWCVAHPFIVAMAWPVFSAAVTFVFSKHSDDDYAKLPVPLAHALRFIAALGIDSGSVLAAFAKLFGLGKPPSAPPGQGPFRTPDPPKDDTPVPPMASKSRLGAFIGTPTFVSYAAMIVTMGVFSPIACKGLTPGKIQNIENVVNTVEQDACILATDFAPNTDAQTIAEVCGFVEAGTPIAEDVLNHILQILESKKRSRSLELQAKYEAKYAAHMRAADAGTK